MIKITVTKYIPKYYTAKAIMQSKNAPHPFHFAGFGTTHQKAIADLFATIKSNNITTITL